MPRTTCSIRILRRELVLGPDPEAALAEFDRQERAAVLRHLLGPLTRTRPHTGRRPQAG